MGQKVHPLGLRVGITKKHQSQWFARFNQHKYAQTILEDHMLRQTLTNLFPQLLNPVLKKVKKREDDKESNNAPRVTQILIERGLIPYEIGIQIHAENCSMIQSSIENLKMNRDLVCKLQKTRRYLQTLQSKLNDFTKGAEGSLNNELNENSSSKTDKKEETSPKGALSLGRRSSTRGRQLTRGNRRFTRYTKQQLRRRRLVLKRMKKRQSIRRRFKQTVFKALFLTKKGNKVKMKILRAPTTRGKGQNFKKTTSSVRANTNMKNSRGSSFNSVGIKKGGRVKTGANVSSTVVSSKEVSSKKRKTYTTYSVFKSRIKKKFVSLFMDRMNKKFLLALKNSLQEIQKSMASSNGSSLTERNNKWNMETLKKRLVERKLEEKKERMIERLSSLISVLEQKCLNKMESFRKDFIAFGTLEKSKLIGYYQMLTFLKDLKEYVSKIKRKQKNLEKVLGSVGDEKFTKNGVFNEDISSVILNDKTSNELHKKSITVLTKKLNNIENECRKIQWIEYLKQLVQQHRRSNIYLYLSTISEARKESRKLKQFTKEHASFLFGPGEEGTLSERVRLTLEKSDKKSLLEKTLQDVFLEQIEKERNMHRNNAQLTPKIAIKFYSVDKTSLLAKASVVADSVVDALEQRKAFRKVIKDAKETLMRTSGVKGVKIQVSGRLNGAEIARSEWVRAGRVPLQTLRANLDYSYKTANTIYGIIGVKVWIFKGYTKLL
jgi:ribosomal protein S3